MQVPPSPVPPVRRIALPCLLMLLLLTACGKSALDPATAYDTPVKPRAKDMRHPTLEEIDPLFGPNGMLPLFEEAALKSFQDQVPSDAFLKRKANEAYTYERIDIPGARIHGLLCRENDTIAVDSQNGRLLVLDADYDIVREVGKVGFGELEFLWPTAITSANDLIYVLDAVNGRIQVLTQDLAFVEMIKLPRTCQVKEDGSSSSDFVDIAVDAQGNIYVSTMVYARNPRISTVICYRADTKEFAYLGRNFCGYLAADALGQVYAVSNGVTYDRGDTLGHTMAYVLLYRLSPTGMEKICDMPYASPIEDFVVDGDSLIATFRIGGSVDRFSMDGEYIESFKALTEDTYVPNMGYFSSIAMTPNGDILVSIPEINYLIRVSERR